VRAVSCGAGTLFNRTPFPSLLRESRVYARLQVGGIGSESQRISMFFCDTGKRPGANHNGMDQPGR